MSVMLAAKDAGLDSHPMDGFDIEDVRKAFNIPDQYWIPLLLAIGHFDKTKTLMPPKWKNNMTNSWLALKIKTIKIRSYVYFDLNFSD